MKTDIIIISYNDAEELNLCTDSINRYCKDFCLFIEDNNPPNPNRGFTKAVNDGIRKGSSEFIWLLNSDAIVANDYTLPALIERFFYHPKVGIVGSMQLDYKDQDMIRCGGVFPHPFPGGRHRGGRLSMGHWRLPEKQTWQNFASVMIRRSMFDQIGPLDESMYLICSDSSYCYSARNAGYECWYEPRSQVFHGLKVSKTVTEWHRKDTEAFMKKWGITVSSTGSFAYSDLFLKLDTFP
jgi:GT2 family glycosyltransferase